MPARSPRRTATRHCAGRESPTTVPYAHHRTAPSGGQRTLQSQIDSSSRRPAPPGSRLRRPLPLVHTLLQPALLPHAALEVGRKLQRRFWRAPLFASLRAAAECLTPSAICLRRSRARAPASSRAACYGLARASALAASIIASATHTPPSPRCEVSGRRRLRCCARYCDCYQPASPLLPRTFCSHTTTPLPPLAHAHALAHAHRTPLHHPACCSTPGLDTRRSGPLTRNTPTRSKILATSLDRQ